MSINASVCCWCGQVQVAGAIGNYEAHYGIVMKHVLVGQDVLGELCPDCEVGLRVFFNKCVAASPPPDFTAVAQSVEAEQKHRYGPRPEPDDPEAIYSLVQPVAGERRRPKPKSRRYAKAASKAATPLPEPAAKQATMLVDDVVKAESAWASARASAADAWEAWELETDGEVEGDLWIQWNTAEARAQEARRAQALAWRAVRQTKKA